MLILPDEKRKKIIENAIKAYPLECCGVLLGKCRDGCQVVRKVVPEKNNARRNRDDSFQIDPLEFIRLEEKAEKDNLQIIGFYHSHPDCEAVLSKEDERYTIPELLYPILSVVHGKNRKMKCHKKLVSGEILQEEIVCR